MNAEPSESAAPNGKRVAADEVDALTPREKEVACLLADGLTSADIAAHLCLSKHTIHEHIRHIYDRLNCHHRGKLIARILHSGICTDTNN